jgi:hypothetical protein
VLRQVVTFMQASWLEHGANERKSVGLIQDGSEDSRRLLTVVMDRVGGFPGVIGKLDRQRLAVLRIGFVER